MILSSERKDSLPPGTIRTFDVAVVGCGPVGATLAILLGLHGLSVVVFEKEAAPYTLPRAVHFDGEVMRVFQTAGVAETLLPLLFVNLGMRFVNARQELLIDWPRPQGLGAQGWAASYRFHQPHLEAVLRAALTDFPQHQVRQSVEVVGIEDDGLGVTVSSRAMGATATDRTRCGFLVGCDGARSFVRGWLGSGQTDLNSNAQWLVVDVLMNPGAQSCLSDWTIQVCDPARPTTIARGTGRRRRWEFMVMPNDDPAALIAPAFIWSLLARWISPQDAQLERSALYRFNAAVAEIWTKGRVLIAGDAAHETPPFLGQGLCAGIRDAANLAWKLASVVRGAPRQLLDSYESERKPHVREFVAQAVRIGEFLQATTDVAVRERDDVFTRSPQQMETPDPALGPGPGLHDPADPLGGKLFHQPWLDGRRLDDIVGSRFAMVARPDLVAELAAAATAHASKTDIVVVPDPHGGLDRLGAVAVVLRPDRYILASASDPSQAATLLDRLDSRIMGSAVTQGRELCQV